MATQAELTLFSPIKVNLYLRIVGRRPDGYHDLETVMLPLDFGDTLTFRPQPSGITMTCDNPSLPIDDRNLVVRAARLLGHERGAQIALTKRAPLAAGVGGGSSNAATTLLGLNRLWRLGLETERLAELAARLGSDINFFLQPGTAICRGRGERVEPIPCRLSAHVLLVNPGFGIPTPWAYATWAGSARRLTCQPPDVTVLARALAEDDLSVVSRCLFNDLEAPSVGKFSVLALLKQELRDAGASGALMSGSGATVFGLFTAASAAAAAGERIRTKFGPATWTCVTRFAAR